MSLFDSVDTRSIRVRTYRIAAPPHDEEFTRSQGLGTEGTAELEELVGSYGASALLRDVRDGPFKVKSRLKRAATRFSDGTFGVFYSTLEVETASAEVEHWLPGRFEAPHTSKRTLHYALYSCDFAGTAKDLRPSEKQFPNLTSDDYQFCQKLGAEAKSAGLGAFLAPSARRAGGTNLPVFDRNALSLPETEARIECTLDPSTGTVSTRYT